MSGLFGFYFPLDFHFEAGEAFREPVKLLGWISKAWAVQGSWFCF